MSVIEETELVTDTGIVVREFHAQNVEVRGRTVDVRLVPFGEVARVADPPRFEPYDEEWLPGAFDHQLSAANRIHAKYGNSESVLDVVGHGISLRSVPGDGYHISAAIHETPQGDVALELIRGGALPSVSLEAHPVKSMRTRGGLVQRMKANLVAFAFCAQGAFAGARVLALREEQQEAVMIDEELAAPPLDDEIVERLRSAGIHLPETYDIAHPAEDTPAESGTPETAPADGDNPQG